MEVEESAALSIAEQFISVPGGRLFVRQWRPAGTGNSPLILLHDSLGSVAQWRDFPAALALRL